MNDWIQAILSTLVAPGLLAFAAYLFTIRKERADIGHTNAQAGGEQASTAEKYRAMLNDEIERRKLINDECEQAQDALKQAADENADLLATIHLLQQQLRSAGIIPFTDIQRSQTKPKGGND